MSRRRSESDFQRRPDLEPRVRLFAAVFDRHDEFRSAPVESDPRRRPLKLGVDDGPPNFVRPRAGPELFGADAEGEFVAGSRSL